MYVRPLALRFNCTDQDALSVRFSLSLLPESHVFCLSVINNFIMYTVLFCGTNLCLEVYRSGNRDTKTHLNVLKNKIIWLKETCRAFWGFLCPILCYISPCACKRSAE